jgi:hypothetical protein
MTEPSPEGVVPAGFEPVHVELGWYDGPRAGLADVDGSAHYFQAVHDYGHPDVSDDEYFVWPASATAVAMEREQWMIFAEWEARHEAGEATLDSHPGNPGADSRFDELDALLAPHRAMPARARRLAAEWHWGNRATHVPRTGPLYWVRWREPNP